MLRTHYSSDIKAKDDRKHVRVAGWMRSKRDMGKVLFLILHDLKGDVQITLKKNETPDSVFETAKKLGNEDVIAVSGVVRKSDSAPEGREISPDKIDLLNKAKVPLPLDIKGHAELDTRLDHRYLDMRKPHVRAIFRIKDVVQKSFINYFDEQGFLAIHPPAIVASATESGAALFPISYFDKEAFLAQSPQLYKQMVMASGIDKVYIVMPVFRAEEHDTTRHLNEVVQMDIELAFVEDEEDALKHLENVIAYICKRVNEECEKELKVLKSNLDIPKTPFKRLTYDEALDLLKKDNIKIKWGEDLPPDGERALCKHSDPVIIKKWPTDVRAFYSMPEPGNEKICRAYDLLYKGMEICSGAQRIHKEDILTEQLKKRKMSPKNFEFYLEAFRYGMPPHAGWSIGLERLTMAICGLKNIREASLYPRTRTRLVP